VPLYPKLAYHPEKDFEPVACWRHADPDPGAKIFHRTTQGIHQLRKSQHRKMQHGPMPGSRLGLLSSCGAFEFGARHQAGRRAVQRHRTGDERAGRRQVDYMCDQIVNAVPQIKAAPSRLLQVARPERKPSLPRTWPTTVRSRPGRNTQGSGVDAIFAPKGTPAPVLAKIECRRGQGAG
jgi:hypothetical protein